MYKTFAKTSKTTGCRALLVNVRSRSILALVLWQCSGESGPFSCHGTPTTLFSRREFQRLLVPPFLLDLPLST
eukprot:6122449-Amphidinium_carterae.3